MERRVLGVHREERRAGLRGELRERLPRDDERLLVRESDGRAALDRDRRRGKARSADDRRDDDRRIRESRGLASRPLPEDELRARHAAGTAQLRRHRALARERRDPRAELADDRRQLVRARARRDGVESEQAGMRAQDVERGRADGAGRAEQRDALHEITAAFAIAR